MPLTRHRRASRINADLSPQVRGEVKKCDAYPNTAIVCRAAITGFPVAFQIVMFCPE